MTLALGPYEHGHHNDMRTVRRYERQLSTLGSLSRCFAQREGAGYRKEIFDVFLALVLHIFAALKSYGGEPERLGIICLDFPFFVLIFEHVKLARVDDLDDGMTWTFTCCIL